MARSGPQNLLGDSTRGRPALLLPTRILPAWMLGALLVLGLAAPLAWAAGGDYRVTDDAKVFQGNPRLFQRPATILCDRIYAQIAEYQEIRRKGLTDKDPRYHFLLKRASERFSDAVKAMARDSTYDHDLVAEQGAVVAARKDVAEIPDRTDAVIAKLN